MKIVPVKTNLIQRIKDPAFWNFRVKTIVCYLARLPLIGPWIQGATQDPCLQCAGRCRQCGYEELCWPERYCDGFCPECYAGSDKLACGKSRP